MILTLVECLSLFKEGGPAEEWWLPVELPHQGDKFAHVRRILDRCIDEYILDPEDDWRVLPPWKCDFSVELAFSQTREERVHLFLNFVHSLLNSAHVGELAGVRCGPFLVYARDYVVHEQVFSVERMEKDVPERRETGSPVPDDFFPR